MGGEDEKGSIHGEREPKHFDGLKIVDETNGSGKSETYSMHGRDLLNIEHGVGNGMLSGRILWRQRWEHVVVERNRVVRGDAAFVQHRIVYSKIIRELEIWINRFAGKYDLTIFS